MTTSWVDILSPQSCQKGGSGGMTLHFTEFLSGGINTRNLSKARHWPSGFVCTHKVSKWHCYASCSLTLRQENNAGNKDVILKKTAAYVLVPWPGPRGTWHLKEREREHENSQCCVECGCTIRENGVLNHNTCDMCNLTSIQRSYYVSNQQFWHKTWCLWHVLDDLVSNGPHWEKPLFPTKVDGS